MDLVFMGWFLAMVYFMWIWLWKRMLPKILLQIWQKGFPNSSVLVPVGWGFSLQMAGNGQNTAFNILKWSEIDSQSMELLEVHEDGITEDHFLE